MAKKTKDIDAYGMQHWNGHIMCAIDTETTGTDDQWHELIQICIMPLNYDLKPIKTIAPFYVELMPDYPERVDPEAIGVNKVTMAKIAIRGIDREQAKDVLEEWIGRLGLPYTRGGIRKRLIPLGHNYAFDRGFIMRWLGNQYEDFFDGLYRDTMQASLYANDRAAFHGEKVPYSKNNLSWLAKEHNLKFHSRAHDAMQDCIVTAETYRQMVMTGLMG